ncbi:glycosyltransferase [Roseomonas nepalensis]|uniref:Glycosyltransferase n=1 Tax=Muricoccus nepalensis TaxID=1854500 RepID=A0A502GFB1_9PROT|nr:glycosyltransferase [Roseomonas nepalensis]TPG60292.1 glycosyltransferase [Roseomonas nepalensis]
MRVLLVHPNFPGQYAHVLPFLAARPGTRVAGIGARAFPVPDGVDLRVYDPPPPPGEEVPPRARPAQAALARAERVARLAIDLRRGGFVPDVVLGHIGWGDTLFLKDVFPQAPLLLYAEFFYSATGADVGHEPGKPATLQDAVRVRTMNMPLLSAMGGADWGAAPTRWQRDRFPEWFRSRISLMHEGVDTEVCRPDPEARFALSDGTVLRPGDEVVTYVARGLEPYRGFPTFMRALPALLEARPGARVVIVGADGASYGRPPEGAASWREAMLAEVGPLDPARVHFLGRIPHPALHALFRVSAAHVYLTVPFVLSWSVLEAMACGALVVGSATPPVQEVIEDGVNGLLTDLYDAPALARRLAEALADPARHAPLREAARRTVEKRFDLKRVCLPRQVAVIDALAARKRPLTYA